MSEEQREILQMVSEGKITADDGAKLLDALRTGEQKRREMESPARRVKEKKRHMHESSRTSHFGGMAGMRDIGRMVRGIMKESVSGFDGEFVEIDEEMCEDAGNLEDPIQLKEGTELVLKRRINRGRNSGGDLVMNGVNGSNLEVIGEDTPDIHIYRDNGTVYLKWNKGDLTLNVPETVGRIRASIMGGDITMNSVSAKADIKTKGGDIGLSEVSRGFNARTMGGDIIIKLNDSWNEDSVVATMGGDIELRIMESTKAEISGRTLGGEISVQKGISSETESGHAGSSRVNIDLSGGEDVPGLSMKTMGGDISVTMSGTEPSQEKNAKKKRSGKKKK